ncbi:hypothetical protein RHMOL_Rhmol02G0218000 [Rhododendron molle]|uniref:Uncharacterized protein n=1 Tax=Rhododendron molle TaxID=49168 RepID=A0ACC0PSU5_RHOML|nr:hypothetical protein RHMOL_Rhmol02G0218000 [Rhododendron molle]
MVDYPQGLPYEFWVRKTERVEMNIFFRTLWMQLVAFILLCAVLTIRIPPWFDLNMNLGTLWKWILTISVIFAVIIKEYENR